jgi:hypothetical protein
MGRETVSIHARRQVSNGFEFFKIIYANETRAKSFLPTAITPAVLVLNCCGVFLKMFWTAGFNANIIIVCQIPYFRNWFGGCVRKTLPGEPTKPARVRMPFPVANPGWHEVSETNHPK